jgi:signal transduction histidine kinase
MSLGGAPYQVIALLSYHDPFRDRLRAVFGFMVNLTWVRQRYFQDLTAQVSRIGRSGDGVDLTSLDARGSPIAGTLATHGAVTARREFPALFFDPRLLAAEWPNDLAPEVWTTQAVISGDPALLAVDVGARRTLVVAVVSAVALWVGLVLIVRAARANARLADMRSEFVSTVSHELKTPIATIQAISETFASDRGITPELYRKYGRLTLHEAKRLRRLIDNLLAYAQITDVTQVYAFEAVAPAALVDTTLRDFASQLEYAKFDVTIDVPRTLPDIHADRRALSLAFGNLVDNAIRYSQQSRHLSVAAFHRNERVVIEVTDRGMGIPPQDLPHVTRRFFRGAHGRTSGGNGLGLAIVDRIIKDHQGSLSFQSTVGVGTTVSLSLPIAETFA